MGPVSCVWGSALSIAESRCRLSAAQDLYAKLKALVEEYRDAPGLAYPVIALEGLLGHVQAAIHKEAYGPAAEPTEPVVTPPAPAPKPAPTVQVAKPHTPSS